MIRAQVNVEDFLKSTVNVGEFTRKFKCNHYFLNPGDSRPVPGMYGLRCNGKNFFH